MVLPSVLTIALPQEAASSESAAPARRGMTEPAPASRAAALREFIAGPENRLASVAVASLVSEAEILSTDEVSIAAKASTDEAQRDDARQPLSDLLGLEANPLVLYGPPGCGKSHLARGLAQWWRKRHGADAVVMLSGAEFAQQHAAAVERQQLDAWRKQCRTARFFVLDDLHQLLTKSSAQREFVSTLEVVLEQGGQLVVTSRSLPQQTHGLLAALRSRLSAGLAAPLVLPGTASRRAIIERMAQVRGWRLSKRSTQLLADGLKLSAAALWGALLELEMGADGAPLDQDRIEQFLVDFGQPVLPSVRAIAAATAKHFRLTLGELRSATRRQAIVAARGVAIYLSRQLTDKSLEQIGAFFGGRDHTTVLHACRRTEDLLKRDAETQHAVTDVKKLLHIA